jgi:hypothetical protein
MFYLPMRKQTFQQSSLNDYFGSQTDRLAQISPTAASERLADILSLYF